MQATLVDEVIAAHGGLERWHSIEGLEAHVSARGWLFTARRCPPLEHHLVRISTTDVSVSIEAFPTLGLTGEFTPDEVRIRNATGAVVSRRAHPRDAFRGFRRQIFWDDFDLLYFAGYALWNYFATPFMFTRTGFRCETLPLVKTADGPCHRLRVRFPPDVPSHCEDQMFYFDDRYRLVRLDYTADVIGWYARGVHVCGGHRFFDGLLVPTVRRVTPRFFGRAMPGPTIVGLTVHDMKAI